MTPVPTTCRQTCRCTLLPLLLLAATARPAAAQRGFDWDHPDGLGVRYLLYERMEKAAFDADDYPPEMRARFQPRTKSDWVRINGTELAWGMHVYEFRGDDAEDGLGRFLQERDPRRTFREFRVEGKPIGKAGKDDEERRYFEFVDTWRPFLEVLDRPQPRGPFRWAVSPELGVRFLADKTMDYVDPFVGTDGDNCYARLHPAPSEWLRIGGVPGPVAWMLRLYVFPDMPRERSASDRDDLVGSFAAFVDGGGGKARTYAREVSVRGEPAGGDGLPHRVWRWIDARTSDKDGTTPFFHAVAAVYAIGGREVALVGTAPADEREAVPEPMRVLAKCVGSLEEWSGKARAPGFAFYNVAASCRVGDREVGVVVHLPIGTDRRPEKELLDVARRMVHSIEPEAGK